MSIVGESSSRSDWSRVALRCAEVRVQALNGRERVAMLVCGPVQRADCRALVYRRSRRGLLVLVLIVLLVVLVLGVLHPLCTLLERCLLLELVILHKVEGARHACCYGDTHNEGFWLWLWDFGRFFWLGRFVNRDRGHGRRGFGAEVFLEDCGDVRVYTAILPG